MTSCFTVQLSVCDCEKKTQMNHSYRSDNFNIWESMAPLVKYILSAAPGWGMFQYLNQLFGV